MESNPPPPRALGEMSPVRVPHGPPHTSTYDRLPVPEKSAGRLLNLNALQHLLPAESGMPGLGRLQPTDPARVRRAEAEIRQMLDRKSVV